jgi:CRP-like cAMP-binding protein
LFAEGDAGEHIYGVLEGELGLMIGDQNDSQIMLDWALLLAAT